MCRTIHSAYGHGDGPRLRITPGLSTGGANKRIVGSQKRKRPYGTRELAADLKDASPVFSLTNAKLKVEATTQQFGDEFTVLRGSRIGLSTSDWLRTARSRSRATSACSRGTCRSARRPRRGPSPWVARATGASSGRHPTGARAVTGRTAGWSREPSSSE